MLAGRVKPSSEDVLPEGTQVTVRFGDGSTDTMRVVTLPEDTTETLTRNSPLGRTSPPSPARRSPTRARTATVVADVLTIRPPTG